MSYVDPSTSRARFNSPTPYPLAMPQDLLDNLNRVVAELGSTKAVVIRTAIANFIEAHDQAEQEFLRNV